jgi:hypothetical protein
MASSNAVDHLHPTHGAHGGALAGKQIAPASASTSTYVVHIKSAANLSDEDWVAGLSDPYCRLTFAGQDGTSSGSADRTILARTRKIKSSHEPCFDEALAVDVPSDGILYAELWDADVGKGDDFLGDCVLMSDGADLAAGSALELTGKKGTLSVSVAPHPLGDRAGRAAVVQARTDEYSHASIGGVLDKLAAAGLRHCAFTNVAVHHVFFIWLCITFSSFWLRRMVCWSIRRRDCSSSPEPSLERPTNSWVR